MNLAAEHANILIYGAHLVAQECYRHLCAQGLGDRVIGFAVTDLKDNPSTLEDRPVKAIEDYAEYANDCLVLIAIPRKHHGEVLDHAAKQGFRHFESISLEQMSEMKGKRLLECNGRLPFALTKSENDPTWLDVHGDAFQDGCKYPTLFYLGEDEMIEGSKLLGEMYQSELRDVHRLDLLSGDESKASGNLQDLLQIFMAFDASVVEAVREKTYDPWVRPLWLGIKNDSDWYKSFRDDDFSGNLSEQNRFLAEMTGAYWIRHRAPGSKYKGLCHYRRHFVLDKRLISEMQANNVDVLLTTPRFVPGGIRGMFLAETPVKEPVMKSMFSAVRDCSQGDADNFSEYLDGHFYFPNNMVVAKSAIYDAYCDWIFPILLRMLEMDRESGYGHENDRHIAYAAELLTSFYFAKKRKEEFKIVFTDYRFHG